MNNNPLTLLGLIKRAGKLDYTDSGCRSALNESRSCLIILASDSSEAVKERYIRRSGELGLPCIVSVYSKNDIALSLGCSSCSVLSINESGFAKKIQTMVEMIDIK